MVAKPEKRADAPPAFAILKPPLLHAVTGRTTPVDAAARRRLRRGLPAAVTTGRTRRPAARAVTS